MRKPNSSKMKNFLNSLSVIEKIIYGIVLILFLFLFYITLDANKYRATVRAIEGKGKVGVNPTDEVLDFGDLSPGTSAVRKIDIQNKTFIPFYVIIVDTGKISDLTKKDKNFFTVSKGKNEKVEFSIYMPASAPIDKTLNGKVYVFKIPKMW